MEMCIWSDNKYLLIKHMAVLKPLHFFGYTDFCFTDAFHNITAQVDNYLLRTGSHIIPDNVLIQS